MSSVLLQDPDERLDYASDFTAWIGSDVISVSVWEIDPSAGVTLDGQVDDFVSNKSAIFVSGLVRGNIYSLTNRITTTGGRTADRSFSIRCGRR